MAKVTAVVKVDDQASKTLKEIKSRIQELGSTAKNIQSIQMLDLIRDVGQGIKEFMSGAYQGYSEAGLAVQQLEGALQATGNATGIGSQQFQAMADAIEKTKLVSAEAVLSSAALAASIGTIKGDNLQRVISISADMSKALGKDMQSIVQAISTAFSEDGSISKLKSLGLVLDEATIAMVDNLREQGDLMGAQGFLIQQLEGRYQGMADVMADSLAGSTERANIAMDDFKESLIEAADPLLRLGNSLKQGVFETLQKMPEPLKTGAAALAALTVAIPGAVAGFAAIKAAVVALNISLSTMGGIGIAIAALSGVVAIASAINNEMTKLERKQAEIAENARQAAQGMQGLLSQYSEQEQLQILGEERVRQENLILETKQRIKELDEEYWDLVEQGVRAGDQRVKQNNEEAIRLGDLVRFTQQKLDEEARMTKAIETRLEREREVTAQREAQLQKAKEEAEAARRRQEHEAEINRLRKEAENAAQAKLDEARGIAQEALREDFKPKELELLEYERQIRKLQTIIDEGTLRPGLDYLLGVDFNTSTANVTRALEILKEKAKEARDEINKAGEPTAGTGELDDPFKVSATWEKYATQKTPYAQIAEDIAILAKDSKVIGAKAHDNIIQALENAQAQAAQIKFQGFMDNLQTAFSMFQGFANQIASIFTVIDQGSRASAQAQIRDLEGVLKARQNYYDQAMATARDLGQGTADIEAAKQEELARIQDEINQKKNEQAKKEFEAGKKNQIGQALMSGAQAIMQTMAQFGYPFGLAPSLLMGSLTGAQVAVIAQQQYIPQFASGGILYPSGDTGGRLFRAAEYETEYIFRQSQLDAIRAGGSTYVTYQVQVNGLVGDGEKVIREIDSGLKRLQAREA